MSYLMGYLMSYLKSRMLLILLPALFSSGIMEDIHAQTSVSSRGPSSKPRKSGTLHDFTVIKQSEWAIQRNDTLDYAFETYGDAKALMLKRKIFSSKSATVAYPKGLDFKNGIIEADIASPAGKAGFVGLAFRIKDAHHYETIYFRPGSSGSAEAVQYMPEKKEEFNWWDYEDLKYQARATLPVSTWFHIKLVVKGSSLTVFVGNEPKPVFVYTALDTGLRNGSVGFWLGNCAAGAYRNLKVRAL